MNLTMSSNQTPAGKEVVFNVRGNQKQKEAFKYWLDDETRQIVYGGAKGGGKSYLGVSLIFGDAFMYPGTAYFIARKRLGDLRKNTRQSVKEVLDQWGIPESEYRYNGQDNMYILKNGSKVFFLECAPRPSDPIYAWLGSVQMTRGWIEEAGELEDVGARNALFATIGRWKNKEYGLKGKMLITCNPQKNFLYTDFYEPWKSGTLPKEYKFIQALPTDNKSLPADYIEGLEQSLSYNEKQRLLYGNWEYDDDPSVLIDYQAILDIFGNTGVVGDKKYITADIARLGGAKIVCIVWTGYIGEVHSWDKALLPVTLEKIEELRIKNSIEKKHVLVDGDGIGAGVQDFGGYEAFRNNMPPFYSLDSKKRKDVNGKIIRENFDNRKSQMGFYMSDMINERKVRLICKNPDDKNSIIQELEQVRQKQIGTDMKKGLVPKEEVIKRLRRSPDFWDAILMRRAFEYMHGSIKMNYRNGNDVNRHPIFGGRRRWQNVH